MARYSKRVGDGVTAHYNSAEELQQANNQEFTAKVRSIGAFVGFVGAGWIAWSTIMAHGGAEWPKFARVLVTLLSAVSGGAALYFLSVMLFWLAIAVVAGSFIWGGLKWLWSAI
ncbi:hypothetical protein ACPRNU_24570 [Chromobacterium vaccinii]|uniref:hypothetical protein n=1 Tax=Chromobacterium vaccinii TaxID=1108595 RepID=UPI003C72458B